MSSFQYDVFISYSSEDRPWAEKLWQSLKSSAPGLRVFFDQKSLRVGEEWDPQLATAVEQSKHLVVFWSEAASDSPWVQNELATFKVYQRAEAAGERRIIALMLDQSRSILGATQSISIPSYKPKEAPNVNADTWQEVVNRVVSAIKGTSGSPIWRLFFTLTCEEFMKINPSAQYAWGPSLEDFLKDLGIVLPTVNPGLLRDVLERQYKARRQDWEPFGKAGKTIEAITEEVRTRLNADSHVQAAKIHYVWQDVGEDFWRFPNTGAERDEFEATRRKYVTEMKRERALIVVDPIAFYSSVAKDWFEELDDCLVSETTVVLVVPPFETPRARTQLHDVVRRAARKLSPYYEPPIPASRLAACGLDVSDEREVERLMRVVVGHHLASAQRGAAAHEALKQAD